MKNLLIALLVSLAATTALASPVIEEVQGGHSMLENPHFHILAVSIKSVKEGASTNAQPPSGVMQVDEVLRGRGLKPREYNFSLMAPVTHADFKEDGNTLRPQWHGRELLGPEAGDRLIVFAHIWRKELDKNNRIVLQGPTYRMTGENRARILELMAPLERSMRVQLPLIGVMLLLPVASAVVFVMSRLRDLARQAARKRKAVSLAMALIVFPVYVYYESGISPYSDIRVDLLLVLPALLAALAMVLVGVASLVLSRR